MPVFPILTLIMALPAVAAVLILLVPRRLNDAIAPIAAGFMALSLLLSLAMMFGFDRAAAGFQFVEKVPWIPSLGVGYHMAVDGFSAPLVALNAIVGFCAVLISWRVSDRPREFMSFLLFLISGVFGAFMALDVFLFLIFYELVLFPVYVLVAGWGSKNREYAAMKLTIYLFLGSLVAIIGLLFVYFNTGRSFDFLDMQRGVELVTKNDLQQVWLRDSFPFVWIFVGFGVLASLWPLHNWSPDGYAAAPTAVSMLHGGVLKATGAYAALRFGVQILPEAARYWTPIIVFFAFIGLLYAGLIAFRQKDLKYIIGFSSVSHLGLVLMGICAMNGLGLNGAGLELAAGGVMTGLMFALVGIVYERSHERDFTKLDGLAKVMPVAAFGYVVGSLAAMGMPGLSGFPAEMQIFMGMWQAAQKVYPGGGLQWWFAPLALAGVLIVVINAAWMLRVGAKMYFSESTTPAWQKLRPLEMKEKFAIVLMSAVLIFVGVLPFPVMSIIESGVAAIAKAIGG